MLEEEDRDFPSKFIFKLIKSEPRLWKYGLKVIWYADVRNAHMFWGQSPQALQVHESPWLSCEDDIELIFKFIYFCYQFKN